MKGFLSILILLVSTLSVAGTKLVERIYKIRVQVGTFTCSEPTPPTGHNFPNPTLLTFSLPAYSLWSSDIWTNVSNYFANDVDYQPCSTFAKFLHAAPQQKLIGTVTQKIVESYHLNGNKTTCLRSTREESELVVEGVKFLGVNEFIVGPLDQTNCHAILR